MYGVQGFPTALGVRRDGAPTPLFPGPSAVYVYIASPLKRLNRKGQKVMQVNKQSYECPERLKHVFEHFGIEPKRTSWTTVRGEAARILTADGVAVLGYVYIIASGKYAKIGRAVDLSRRLRILQVGNPVRLRIIRAFETDDMDAHEWKLQELLNDYHVRGEWYELPDEVIVVIEGVRDIMQLLMALKKPGCVEGKPKSC